MSNYIVEAFKAMNLLESEDISLNADGVDTLSGFMAEAGIDPDEEEVDVFDIEAGEEDELKQSYVGKVVLECSVCHSNIFVDKSEVSVGTDEEGLACYDIECPYCMSNDGYEIIGEVAPFNAEESEELINPEDEEEIPAVDVEGAVDDVDEEDLEESYKTSKKRKTLKEGLKSIKVEFDADLKSEFEGDKDEALWSINDIASYYGIEATKVMFKSNSAIVKGDEEALRRYLADELGRVYSGPLPKVSSIWDDELEESLKKQQVKESWEHEFEAEYDSIQNDPSLSDEEKKEYIKKLFADFSMNEELKLDGVKELYDNDEIRGVDDLEGVDELEGVKELHGEKHEAPIEEALDPADRMTDEEKLKRGWVVNGKKRVLVNTPDGKVVAKTIDTDEPDSKASDFVRESIKSKKNKKSLKEGLDDIIEYDADFDPNLGTLEEYKEVLKSYGLKFIKQNDYNGWNPYVVFEGSKKNIIAFLTSDFYGETEESLRESDPSLFESLKSKRNKKSLKEDIEDVTVSTEDETMTMTTKDDGGVVIETSPKEEFIDEMPIEGGDEMIVPLEDESVDEIEAAADANSVEEGEETIDFDEVAEEEPSEEFGDLEDFEDFDEESFNGLGESYLRSCYENVSSFKTTGASVDGKKLIIEGMIKFDSGNIKETEFVFESLGKGKFEGYNKQISRGKKTYKLTTSIKNNKPC